MAKLYFHYASMNAGKSARLLTDAYNYQERGMKVAIFKPMADTRTLHMVSSRIGLNASCELISPSMDLFWDIQRRENISCVFVDEAQFLSKRNVSDLCRVVDELNIPVMAYGLRTDFQLNLFEGSYWLLAWADEIRELRGMCHCGRKATTVARIDAQGNFVTEGAQVEIGAEDKYVSLCRKHYHEKVLDRDANNRYGVVIKKETTYEPYLS